MKPFASQQRRSARSRETRPREKGYVLLTMLLVVALMGIFALAAYTTVEFEIRRDQETEMIHRGVQYTRAIRAYYKKFQRYPTKLEDLDNTNNLRYLRKHYKDPLNKNQDFRLLHYGEPGLAMIGSIGGGSIPGAVPAGSSGGLNGPGQSASAFGGSGLGGGSGFGSSGVNSSGVFAQSSGNGPNSNNQGTADQPGTTPAGSDPSAQSATGGAQASSSSGGQQLIASGPIVGVASFCKKTTIREFNKKKRYNEWQFVYDPTADRGGLITTPYQPLALQNQVGGLGTPAGQLAPGGQSGSSVGGAFGQSSTFGNSPSGNTPTSTNPPQQQ